MKRIYLLASFILLSVFNIFGQDSTLVSRADSMIRSRGNLYQRQNAVLTGLADSSAQNMKIMLQAKDSLLLADQEILDELFPELMGAHDTLSVKLKNEQEALAKMSAKYAPVEKYRPYFIPVAAGVGVLLLFFLVMWIMQSSAKEKVKKQLLKSQQESAKNIEDLTKIRAAVEQEEKDLALQKQVMQKEKDVLKTDIEKLQNELKSANNRCTQSEEKVRSLAGLEEEKIILNQKIDKLEQELGEISTLNNKISGLEQTIADKDRSRVEEMASKEQVISDLQQEIFNLRQNQALDEMRLRLERSEEEATRYRNHLEDALLNHERYRVESEEKINALQHLADEEKAVRKEMEQVIRDYLNK